MLSSFRARPAAVLLLLALASGPAGAQSAPAAAPTPVLQEHEVLTWNVGTINPADVRLPTRFEDEVVAVLAEERSDVVLLQEVQGEEQMGRLQAALHARGLPYQLVVESSDPRREDGRAMAVLHLAPACGTATFSSTVAGGFRARAVLLPGLTVINIHAPTSLDHRREFFPQLVAWTATLPGPVVLAGDFNLGPARGSGASLVLPWRWKHDQALYRELARRFPTRTRAASTTLYGQIFDHVMTDAGRLVAERVLLGRRSFPQDHDPILVTLALPAPAPADAPAVTASTGDAVSAGPSRLLRVAPRPGLVESLPR